MAFLYDILLQEFGKKLETTKVPNDVVDNLKYKVRPYQKEAFQRYILSNTYFEQTLKAPIHLLYNMATGSGKTLVMAGLMLYLYKKGYRHFLFFVNSNNIINKTKENFLNQQASKYLFNKTIIIDAKAILIKEVANFEESDIQNININFTTIQQLHLDLNTIKENRVSYEDFKNKKVALFADEAHHLSSGTRNKKLSGSWENTVLKILHANNNNVLLEFTATLDYQNKDITEKYQNKVIQKYDLAQFRIDKYSKEIHVIQSLYDEKDRIIQALILHLYRQELATSKGINLKPVILFKAQRTIKESEQNKQKFHQLIDNLSVDMIHHIQKTATVLIVQKAFLFFKNNTISSSDIVKKLKSNFKEENCISANNDKETAYNQMVLNTLEDDDNPIRAVFAVQKLNEGWDVLNLFDIVRLYDSQTIGKKTGKTTLSEAQLIGRGARYFPFVIDDGQDKYKRKFDNDISNDLKILEELYYHTKEDSRYISELKKALIKTGIYDDAEYVTVKMHLKSSFKKSTFYKKGHVIYNKRILKKHENVKTFSDLGVLKHHFEFVLSSGLGDISAVFTKTVKHTSNIAQKQIAMFDIPKHIIRFALSEKPFFHFDNLIHYLPNVTSIDHFIKHQAYLGGFKITFKASEERLKEISNTDYLEALREVLRAIKLDIKSQITQYTGSDYIIDNVRTVFKNKIVKQRKNSGSTPLNLPKCSVYNVSYGTSKDYEFVQMMANYLKKIELKYTDVFLLNNEKQIQFISKQGKLFEPSFVLFCTEKKSGLHYQITIESKVLKKQDIWKKTFFKDKPFVHNHYILANVIYTKASDFKTLLKILNIK